MLKRTIACLVLSTVAALTAHAQSRMPDGNIVGPGRNNNSGDAQDATENIGADLYTGKLKAGFDLFGYKAGASGLTHGISIGYDGGGNRVDDVSSNIGANWSLSIGGSIVREIKGIPDETQNGFLASASAVTPVGGLDSTTLMQYISDRMDGQFDIYHFNAGGASGRFIIGKNGDIQTIPRSNIKIEKSTGGSPFSSPLDSCYRIGFTITLENGTRYLFSDFDCQSVNYQNGNHPYASTNWYLTRIISAFGTDSINFSYTPSVGDVLQLPKDYYGYATTNAGSQPVVDYEFTGDMPKSRTVRRMIIDHIDYPDGTLVQFNYTYNRLDFRSDKALNSIDISRNGAGYGFKFLHSYMDRNNNSTAVTTADIAFADYEHTNTGLWNTTDVETLYSLQLDSFYKYSGQQSLPGYGFKYNPLCLPPLGAEQSVDLWGYFNANNQDERKTQFAVGASVYGGGQRLPNIQYAVAKSLQKINLPTGGNVKFTYEAHTTKSSITPNDMGLPAISAIGGLRLKQMVYSDAMGQANDMVRTYQYTETDGITSSGVMANFPRFGYLYTENYITSSTAVYDYNLVYAIAYNHYPFGNTIPANTVNNYLVRNGYPLNDLLYTHGAPVGYGRVTEFAGTTAKYKNKTVYTFTTSNDYPVSSSLLENNFPYPYIPDNDFAWGLPLGTEQYNGAGVLLSKKQNQYDVYSFELNNDNFRGLKIGLKNHPAHNINDYAYKYYYPVTGKVFLAKQVGTSYFAGNKILKDSVMYTYDTAHNVMRYAIHSNANDESIKTQFYYPFDFSQSIAAIKALQVSNADRAFPVRTEKWNLAGPSPRLLDVSVLVIDTVYGQFYTGSNGLQQYKGLVKPKSAYDFTPAQPVDATMWGSFNAAVLLPNAGYFTQTATMDKYDSEGNLVQTTAKGHLGSVIYDEQKQLAIASIGNAAVADVAYTSFEDNSRGGWTENGVVPGVTMPNHFVTGEKGYPIVNNSFSRSGLNVAKKYTISFWVYSGTPKVTAVVNGSTVTASLTASDAHNGWQLYRTEITGATSVSVAANNSVQTIIDELRLYPSDAAMSTTAYTPLYGPNSSCDAGNHVVYNVRDQFGRVRYVKDADGNIRKAIDYQKQDAQY